MRNAYKYILFALAISFFSFTIALFYPHFSTLNSYYSINEVSLYDKVVFTLKMYSVFQSGITTLSAFYIFTISLLAGVNLALFVFYIRDRQTSFKVKMNKEGALSIGGMISGFLGLGCAACGTFVLSAVLSFFGFGAVLTFLPLKGAEIGLIGILFMVYATFILIKKIREPKICKE